MPRGRLFGKLMGGEEEEDQQDEQIEEMDDQDQEIDEAADEESEAASIKAKSKPKKAARVAVEQSGEGEAEASDEQDREEWINEYEGQLTLDVYQTRDNVIIKSTIAGVKSDDLDITIANDMVTIKGERRKEEDIRAEDYFYQECYWGPFSRSIILPVDIDVEGVSAEIKDGILTVVLPKAAKAKTKKIKVKGTV